MFPYFLKYLNFALCYFIAAYEASPIATVFAFRVVQFLRFFPSFSSSTIQPTNPVYSYITYIFIFLFFISQSIVPQIL